MDPNPSLMHATVHSLASIAYPNESSALTGSRGGRRFRPAKSHCASKSRGLSNVENLPKYAAAIAPSIPSNRSIELMSGASIRWTMSSMSCTTRSVVTSAGALRRTIVRRFCALSATILRANARHVRPDPRPRRKPGVAAIERVA